MTRKKLSPALIEQVQALREQGLTFYAIRQRLHVSLTTVRVAYYGQDHTLKNRLYSRKYGITYRQVIQKLVAQDFRCAACHEEFVETVLVDGRRRDGYNLDHNHTTKEVRDLLCMRCNRVVGAVKDRVDVAQGILDYLTRWRKRAKESRHVAEAGSVLSGTGEQHSGRQEC